MGVVSTFKSLLHAVASRTELARKSGVAPSTISRIANTKAKEKIGISADIMEQLLGGMGYRLAIVSESTGMEPRQLLRPTRKELEAAIVDITQPALGVQVEIRQDGNVMWVSVDGITVLRVCQIARIEVTDNRRDISIGIKPISQQHLKKVYGREA